MNPLVFLILLLPICNCRVVFRESRQDNFFPTHLPLNNVPRGVAAGGVAKTCPPGYELTFDRVLRKYDCKCKDYFLYWPEDGLCYREYQQGPCPEGHRWGLLHYIWSNISNVLVILIRFINFNLYLMENLCLLHFIEKLPFCWAELLRLTNKFYKFE